MDSLNGLSELANNENIAIAVLSLMLLICISANIAQFWFNRKDRYELIQFHREDMKNAWLFVSKLSETIKESSQDIAIIRSFAERKDSSAGSG